jgi:ketosteroid isomerase-like protein
MIQPSLPGLTLALALLPAACAHGPKAADEVARVLDDFHDAAAKADEARYLGHLAEDGVFLGTDASERWPKAEFRSFVHPHFAKGDGWTYVPRERHVMVSADDRFAWFDEHLENESYGLVRGTGLLRNGPGGWKVVHYSVTFAVPNDAAHEVVRVIRRRAAEPAAPKAAP